jgi:hypothetical protein
MATDTSGRQAVDFVWGNIPMQPNEDRAGAVSPANFSANSSGDNFWGATTRVASDRLNPALSFHDMVEAKYAGFPEFTGNNDGAYISGVAYIVVPSVIGDTTAVALDKLKDAGYETASITTATAATNAAISITAAARTAGSTTATLTATGAGAAFPVGTKITVASLADTGAPLNGTYTVTAVATNSVSFVSSASTVLALTGLSAGTIVGVAGTIKSQSTAANAASVATTATITVTPYATAS